ncbi:MAG: electron transport complex subunit RsxC [Nitrosomonadales bacterium]|nr:electron transport complex subunit RsxC [Nitrosomonadales bacterium]
MSTLHRFHGGIHPAEHKQESSERPIARAPLPQQLVLPLLQHIGARAKAVVQAGDRVLKGELIAYAEGTVSAALHAPTSGTVLAVEPRAVPHPSGLPDVCIVIEPDGADQWDEHPSFDFCPLSKAELLARLRDGGIVGLGGATFPTHVKMATLVQTLVLNGAECEPWITTDDRLMRERAAEIVEGIAVLRHLVSPSKIVVGIEDNKPLAIAAMRQACAGTDIEVIAIPTLYPSGGERQLIKILTGKEVPSGRRPLDIGVACTNVATAYAVHRVVNHGEPLMARVVTVTGNVAAPQNIEVPLGMSIAEVVRLAGGALPGTTGYILGGPMMGLHVTDTSLPLVKSTNCIIVKSDRLFPPAAPTLPCIRCTRCAQVCPAELQPQDLYWFAKGRELDKAESYHLFDCIECGACSYVCPSSIPLVQYYRYAKSEVQAQHRERAAADHARERHEARLSRIERDKREKAEKLAEKERAAALARQQAEAAAVSPPSADDAQALIQAALQRVRAQAAAPKNTDNLTPEQRAQIAEAEARRAQAQPVAHVATPKD